MSHQLFLVLFLWFTACTPPTDDVAPPDDSGDPADSGEDDSAPAPVPDLVVSPTEIPFGYVLQGSAETDTVVLANAGGAPLTITALTLTDPSFSVDAPLPFTLEAGDSLEVPVTFTATDGAAHTDTLVVTSDDVDGTAEVALSAASVANTPVAVCTASEGEVAVGQPVTLQGNSSYDPSGGAIVDYAWTLAVVPDGSIATLNGSGANRSFVPDVGGDYEATLVVTNEWGVPSEPCTARIEARPVPELAVEIVWTHEGDDMDLHLVRAGGELKSTDDCYYENCVAGLDWGLRGDTSDDPLLELDDIPGTGPEYTTIVAPAEGTYTVYVHDYPGSVLDVANEVTLNVSIDGTLAWTETRTLSTEDEYVPFVDITFPGGAITPY